MLTSIADKETYHNNNNALAEATGFSEEYIPKKLRALGLGKRHVNLNEKEEIIVSPDNFMRQDLQYNAPEVNINDNKLSNKILRFKITDNDRNNRGF